MNYPQTGGFGFNAMNLGMAPPQPGGNQGSGIPPYQGSPWDSYPGAQMPWMPYGFGFGQQPVTQAPAPQMPVAQAPARVPEGFDLSQPGGGAGAVPQVNYQQQTQQPVQQQPTEDPMYQQMLREHNARNYADIGLYGTGG